MAGAALNATISSTIMIFPSMENILKAYAAISPGPVGDTGVAKTRFSQSNFRYKAFEKKTGVCYYMN
jgi:hypothetical protein